MSAKAFDSFGAYGPQKVQTIVLNRRVPYAPQNFKAVMVNDVVEVEWTQAPERDIQGFRVYRRPPSGSDVQVADISDRATQTQDGSNLPELGHLLVLRPRRGQGHGRQPAHGRRHVAHRHPLRQPLAAGSGERHRPARERRR